TCRSWIWPAQLLPARSNNAAPPEGNAMDWHLLLAFLVNGVIVGTLYGVVAMCFVLIYKSTQIVNFAQGQFLLVGAWVCWAMMMKFGMPFFVGFLFTLVFMFIFGVLLQVVLLRPMIGEPIISVIMMTIGLSMVLKALMGWAFGTTVKPFPPIFENDTVRVMGLNIQSAYLMSFIISIVIMAGFFWFFKYSRM